MRKSAKPSLLTSPAAATEAPSCELGVLPVKKVSPLNAKPGSAGDWVRLIGVTEESPCRQYAHWRSANASRECLD